MSLLHSSRWRVGYTGVMDIHSKLSLHPEMKAQRDTMSSFSYDTRPRFLLSRPLRNLYDPLAVTPIDADIEYRRITDQPFILSGDRLIMLRGLPRIQGAYVNPV